MIDINPQRILTRYNVKVEKEMTPEEVAEKLFPVEVNIREVAKAVFEGDEDEVVESIQNAINNGLDPLSLINNALMVGMEIVSTLYDDGVLYLPDVIISAQAMIEGIEYCKERSGQEHEYKGKIVSYVVEGDIHDIGKKIVTVLLRAKGYEVVDLGKDVCVEEVIAAVKREKPIMLTGTSLMTTTMVGFQDVNSRLLESDINVPVVCGGGAVTQDFVSQYELGLYCEEASDVPKIADAIINGLNIGQLMKEFHKH
ncbi:methanol--corrinoid protein MtaC [Methanococcoides alaskense]|uniref:Methanol corrinoid protein n=1 Tax=Methanococcoides alaskense TaxID=325778 RepID=A0AA90U078_9EURY|nr:methanol--corrinoid protein MtaC [Methanococcoides alaskense]MDA0525748.1 methanol--corrinoid protein MtaC [Methanococcoides alaskense]MDR6222974.1 methanol corrinoid protein [Methanococcoides alaskense]